MAHTLTNGATVLALPDNLRWLNEFDWSPVVAAARYSITGALIVESRARSAGRPIELGDDAAYILRSDLLTLKAWAAVPGLQLSLVLRGEAARAVIFDQERPLGAVPLVDYSDPAPGDYYRLSLRFLEV
jgi:hypothetical protein